MNSIHKIKNLFKRDLSFEKIIFNLVRFKSRRSAIGLCDTTPTRFHNRHFATVILSLLQKTLYGLQMVIINLETLSAWKHDC